MNANPKILAALSDMDMPVKWLEYKGDAKEYIVFNDSLNAPSLYADNTDVIDTVSVQVHHYTKGDPNLGAIRKIRSALRDAGFTILETLSTRDYVDGKDTGYIHTVVTVQIDGVSEDFLEN